MAGIQLVRGQIWRETRPPNCGRISTIQLVLGTTVFLQRCSADGLLLDPMLFKGTRSAMMAEDGWELLQF